MDWRQDWKRDFGKMLGTILILGLLEAGAILLLTHGKNFMITVKPGYDIEYLMDYGARKGMHIEGNVPFVYDCFAQMENTNSKKIAAYYYAVPTAEGMIALYVPAEKNTAAEKLLEETLVYLEGGVLPISVISIEGYVVEAQGRIPYLLTQYMSSVGYTEEEIAAMGTPLMIQDATERLKDARIYAPVGMICLALGVLAVVFVIFRKRFRRG